MKWLGICSTLVIASSLSPVSAVAAVFTRAYTFTATDFIADNGGPLPPPLASAAGSFTITLNDAVIVENTRSGLLSPSVNLPHDSKIGYSYEGGGIFLLGGLANGVNIIEGETDDFYLLVTSFNTNSPHFEYLVYENLAQPNYFYKSTSGTLSVAAVPEPASWSLLISGFFLAGALMRLRQDRSGMSVKLPFQSMAFSI